MTCIWTKIRPFVFLLFIFNLSKLIFQKDIPHLQKLVCPSIFYCMSGSSMCLCWNYNLVTFFKIWCQTRYMQPSCTTRNSDCNFDFVNFFISLSKMMYFPWVSQPLLIILLTKFISCLKIFGIENFISFIWLQIINFYFFFLVSQIYLQRNKLSLSQFVL